MQMHKQAQTTIVSTWHIYHELTEILRPIDSDVNKDDPQCQGLNLQGQGQQLDLIHKWPKQRKKSSPPGVGLQVYAL